VHTKETIRKEVLSKRKSLDENSVKELSSKVINSLAKVLRKVKPSSVMLYYPIKGEVNLLPLAEELLRQGVEVSFPKVVGDEIVPLKVSSLKELSPGAFSVPEPPFSEERLSEPQVVVVPGVAFDRRCYRIGYGGGFYDRFLAKNPDKTKIGVCFHFQLFKELPVEPHDQPVDLVITDKTTKRRSTWSQS
jgi:5-formyltetrahydrofolate cyclo-ligase